jgi:hypothetical protein
MDFANAFPWISEIIFNFCKWIFIENPFPKIENFSIFGNGFSIFGNGFSIFGNPLAKIRNPISIC